MVVKNKANSSSKNAELNSIRQGMKLIENRRNFSAFKQPWALTNPAMQTLRRRYIVLKNKANSSSKNAELNSIRQGMKLIENAESR